MLSVGQHFKSFQQLFGVVQNHELDSNGAFELTKEKLPNGCGKVSCKCSGPLDEGSGSCPAFIVAEELSMNDVVITMASLHHNHPWLGPINMDGDSFDEPGVVPEDEPLTPPPILFPAEPFEDDSFNSSSTTNAISFNIATSLKQVPRRYAVADGPLDLRPSIIYDSDKYHCPFCENFMSPSLFATEAHVKKIHEDPAVVSNGEHFIPCYAQCRTDLRRKVNAAHYHCRCGVIFHSVKGITNHARVGFCERFCMEIEEAPAISNESYPARSSDHPQRKAKLDAMEIVDRISKGHTIEFGSPMDQPILSKRRKIVSNKKVNEIDLSTVKSEELAGLLSAGKTVNEALLEIFERMQNEEARGTQSEEILLEEPANQIVVGNTIECVDFDAFPMSEPEPGEIHAQGDDVEWIPMNRPSTTASKKCSMCGMKYIKESDLKSHKSSAHKMEKCRWCPLEFSRKNLMAHIQLHHPQSRLAMPVNLLCTLCGVKLEMVEDLALHYRDDHDLNDCDVERTTFNEATDFYIWKSHMEVDSYSYFVKRRRSISENEVTLFFACFYSWGDNRASLKEKKTERHCPAFIKATQQSGSSVISVDYCLYHVGHELPKERFWKQIQKSLHGLLSFRHKAKSETRRLESELSVKICQPSSSTNWSTMEDGEQPCTSNVDVISASYDLDDAMSFYWDTMHDKLTQSGNYTLSIDGRWSNRAVADPEDRLCRICQVEFKNHKSMMRHMLRIHDPKRLGPQSKYSRPVRCLFCNMEMAPPGMKNLIQHYINAHDQQIQLKMRLFQHIDEFNLWREAVTGNVFKRHKFYQSAKGENRQYWTCKFSGKLQNPPAGVTEGHCPAWIFAQTTADGQVQVSYCLYHIGHELNPESTSADSAVAKRLALQQIEEAQQMLVQSQSGMDDQPSVSMDGEAPTYAILFGNELIQLGVTYQIVEQPHLSASSMLSNIEPLRIGTPPQDMNILPLDSDSGEVMESASMGRGAVNLIVDSIGAPCSSGDLTNGSSFDGMPSTEETILRHQITVLIRSTTGEMKFVKVALSDFPLVTKDGRKYYALDEASLVEAVSQVMIRQGEHLYEGDQLEILQ